MGVQVQQQAIAQQQAEITPTISLDLVRSLLRVSIFHVTYLRGIFPEDHFSSVTMENLEGMQIKMLKPASKNSERLIKWLELGVHDALKQGFLKHLFFGVASDATGSTLIEEYVFSFSYDDGKVQMKVAAGQEASEKFPCRPNVKSNISTIKYQTCRLMRMLVQICATLDKMPEERWLFMRLTYYPHTPEDYEPPTFVPDDETSPAFFPRKPFSMQAGEVTTRHHAVSLKVKSILDSLDDDADEKHPTKLAEMSMQYSNATASEDKEPCDGTVVDQAISKLAIGSEDQCQQACEKTDTVMSEGGPADSQGTGTSDADLVEQNLEAVRTFCFGCKHVVFSNIQKEFAGVATGILERTVEMLVEEGTLQPSVRPDIWTLAGGTSAGHATHAMPGKAGAPRQACLSQAHLPASAIGESREAALPSGVGHAQTESGTKCRRSTKKQENRNPGEPSELADPAAYFEGSQPSGIGKGQQSYKRKLSYVEDPICQTGANLPLGPTPLKQARRSRLNAMGV